MPHFPYDSGLFPFFYLNGGNYFTVPLLVYHMGQYRLQPGTLLADVPPIIGGDERMFFYQQSCCRLVDDIRMGKKSIIHTSQFMPACKRGSSQYHPDSRITRGSSVRISSAIFSSSGSIFVSANTTSSSNISTYGSPSVTILR